MKKNYLKKSIFFILIAIFLTVLLIYVQRNITEEVDNEEEKKVTIKDQEPVKKYKTVAKFPGCPTVIFNVDQCYKNGKRCEIGEVCCLGEERQSTCPNMRCLPKADCPHYQTTLRHEKGLQQKQKQKFSESNISDEENQY